MLSYIYERVSCEYAQKMTYVSHIYKYVFFNHSRKRKRILNVSAVTCESPIRSFSKEHYIHAKQVCFKLSENM